jgi:UBX domain-containing protein 1
MSDQQIEQFKDIVRCTDEQGLLKSQYADGGARFFIAAHNGNLEEAMSSFYETGGAMETDSMDVESAEEPPAPAAQVQGKTSSSKPAPKYTASSARVATLRDVPAEQHEESSEDEGQDYFAGGEKRFALLVLIVLRC